MNASSAMVSEMDRLRGLLALALPIVHMAIESVDAEDDDERWGANAIRFNEHIKALTPEQRAQLRPDTTDQDARQACGRDGMD